MNELKLLIFLVFFIFCEAEMANVAPQMPQTLPKECQSFSTEIDKSACKQHYFTFIFVMIGEPSRTEATRHLNISKWILKPCYDLEPKPPQKGNPQNSLVTFADHDWKINLPKAYTHDEVLDFNEDEIHQIHTTYDWIYITKDINSVRDLASILDIALKQMKEKEKENKLNRQPSVLLLLNALDRQVYDEFGDSLLPFFRQSVEKFVEHGAIAKLVFTIDQVLDPYIEGYLKEIRDNSKGYFDYLVDPMTDADVVGKKYGMCAKKRDENDF